MEQLINQTLFEEEIFRKQGRNQFDKIFLRAVDHAFSTLGVSSKVLLYRYLEEKCVLRREPFALETNSFANTLEAIFGDFASLLEIAIMHRLHQEIPTFLYTTKMNEAFSFSDYLDSIRSFL